MDGLTFIAEILRSLSWPITVIVLVLLLRDPVIKLIPLIKRLKYKELELEFSEGVSKLQSDVSAMTGPDALLQKDPAKMRLYDLLYISTQAAVLEAWGEVESAAVEIASSFWGQPPHPAIRGLARLGQYLHDCKVIDDRDLKVFNQLRDLRNKAAHAEELSLSENDAMVYIEMALRLAIKIRSAK